MVGGRQTPWGQPAELLPSGAEVQNCSYTVPCILTSDLSRGCSHSEGTGGDCGFNCQMLGPPVPHHTFPGFQVPYVEEAESKPLACTCLEHVQRGSVPGP